ncbi:uncharacterized protein LOC110267241 [Arachis ipaensis]|uniref:uncharacterized protein LOC110267241 n=1 Tax=Arachis ipaensis TaxID=130454 RepID=UPI000A2B0B0C|nr:uncharacterized protein LOC110267241 [Arachis ipaensis]
MTNCFKNKVIHLSRFSEVWAKIDDYFQAASSARVQSLKSQLRLCKKTGSAADYLSKIRRIVDALFAVGYEVPEDDHLQAIIEGLSEEYTVYISSVTAKRGSFRIVEAEAFLLSHEEMLERFKKPTSGMPIAHYVQNPSPNFDPNRGNTFRRGRGGRNNRGGGRFGYNNNNTRMQCQLCGRMGHVVWNCYHRFDQSFNPNSGNPNSSSQPPYLNAQPPPPPSSFHQPTAYLTGSSSSISDAAWLADSGASHHLTPDPSNLLTSTASNNDSDQVYVGNGSGYQEIFSTGHS